MNIPSISSSIDIKMIKKNTKEKKKKIKQKNPGDQRMIIPWPINEYKYSLNNSWENASNK